MNNFLKAALLFLMLTASFALHVKAQDYSPIIDDNTSLFQFDDKIIEALQEEPSATPVTDHRGYIIQLVKTWKTGQEGATPGDCNPHNSPTWAGPKYIKGFTTNLDGNHYFFNQYNEEITFSLLKDIGGAWKMYTYANGNYIEATISNKEQLTFLELTDSVKTISLQLKNPSGMNLTDPVNNIVYKISKNHGFIQLTRFLDFPSRPTEIGYLIGSTAPKKGVQLISSRDIFNFNIGDEFHYDSLNYRPDFLHEVHQIRTINIVTDIYRSSNMDTVIYTFDQKKETYYTNTLTSEQTYEYSTGNVQQKHVFSKTQLYPGQANLNTEYFLNNASYWLTLFADDISRSVWNTNGIWYRQNQNDPDCWNEISFDPLRSYSYLEGCGLLLDETYDWNSGYPHSYKKLLYFKKGEEQWGDALILSSTIKKERTNLNLFPNPLKQGELLHFDVNSFNVKQVFIYHVTGTKILESTDEVSPITSLNLSGVQPGSYLVQLVNEKNERVSQQLIIQ